jgi:hypothetical protein
MSEIPLPSVEFLFDCSNRTSQDFELAEFSRGAKALKSSKVNFEEAVRHLAAAEAARYIRENKEKIIELVGREAEEEVVLEFPSKKRA